MQILIANVIPCVFGAFTGLMLGVNAIVYLVLAVPIAILGGYVAGLEHPNGREGAVRGFVGGLQFGAFILVVDALSGLDRKTDLPKPAILLLLLTTIGGTILGFLGGRARERRMRQAA